MDYGQLFAAALQRPSIADTMGQAKDLAQSISEYQMQQRTAPVIQALQQFANNYNAATTDEGRHSANTMANQVRANYLAGGGSPMDLPSNLWGSAPASGFQTTGGFQAPVTGYEGLGRKDAIAIQRQALLDALTRRVQEAGLTGIDPATGEKTWDRQYQEYTLANRGTGGGGGGSGSSGSSSTPSSLNNRATQQAVAQVWAYNTPEEAVTAYGYYGPDMAAQGVDLSKVWNEIKKRWPDYKAFKTEKDNDITQEMAKLIEGGG